MCGVLDGWGHVGGVWSGVFDGWGVGVCGGYL